MMSKVPEKVSECYFNFLLVISYPKKRRIKYQIPKTRPSPKCIVRAQPSPKSQEVEAKILKKNN